MQQAMRMDVGREGHLLLAVPSVLDACRQVVEPLAFDDIVEHALFPRSVLPLSDPQHVAQGQGSRQDGDVHL